MEPKPRLSVRTSHRTRDSQPKFKPVPGEQNQLQSKYDIYRHGSPNLHEPDIEMLKAYHVKNNVKAVQLPAIDLILQELKNVPTNSGTNGRDYDMHPSMLRKYVNRFKNLTSDQQEIRDFLAWITSKQKQIRQREGNASEKFYLMQSLIAAGFNQVLTQIACISAPRADLLKILWNKQVEQLESIVGLLHRNNTNMEKRTLQATKSLHLGYQQQIVKLKSDYYTCEKKLEEATMLNQGCLNSLRIMKRQIKKYEKMIKQLYDSNITLKQESLLLLEENTRLQMREKGLTEEQARILSYRTIQMDKFRKVTRENNGARKILKQVKKKSEIIVNSYEIQDFEEKKEKLIQFIKTRARENPQEKLFVLKGEFSDEEDENIALEASIEQVINTKEIRAYLGENFQKQIHILQQKATNTQECHQFNKPSLQEGSTQTTQRVEAEQTIGSVFREANQLSEQQIMKLKDKRVKQRQSLMMIEINHMNDFKRIDNTQKVRRISKLTPARSSAQNSMKSIFKDINSGKGSKSSDLSDQSSQGEDSAYSRDTQKHLRDRKKKARERHMVKQHYASILIPKSAQFTSMINRIARESSFVPQVAREDILELKTVQKEKNQKNFNRVHKKQCEETEIAELRPILNQFIRSHAPLKNTEGNPQKILKKTLTQTYRNLFSSKKTNILTELVNAVRSLYDQLAYENKLLEAVQVIYQNRQKSFFSTLAVLLRLESFECPYAKVNKQDVSQFYFSIFFYLCLKSPTEAQFNIWNNYTNMNRLNDPKFRCLLGQYFSESKCLYLQLKIKQFVGLENNQLIDGNYYIELNPLMMYLLEVYLLEKQNYYESYHQLLDFVTDSNIELEQLVFLFDLLCVSEEEQSQIIQKHCIKQRISKDIFYQICVKHELPLFEFLKVLKLEQFKKLPENVQNEFTSINSTRQWSATYEALEWRLKGRGKFTCSLRSIMQRLDQYVKGGCRLMNDSFLCLFRVCVETAYL